MTDWQKYRMARNLVELFFPTSEAFFQFLSVANPAVQTDFSDILTGSTAPGVEEQRDVA